MSAKKTTKVTAKKVTAKKVAKKIEEQTVSTSSGYNLLESASPVSKLGNALAARLERRKGREVRMLSLAESKVELYPSLSLYADWLLNARGWPGSLTNIIGRDGTGKTSLLMYLIGVLAKANIPSVYIPCENKSLKPDWIRRCFDTNPAIANRIAEITPMLEHARSLDEMWESMTSIWQEVRDPKSASFIPKHVPLATMLDPLNKLPTPSQMAGFIEYDGQQKEKTVDIADKGHSWDRAKWYHDMTQRLTGLQPNYNVRLFLGEHQNQLNVAGGGGKASSFTPEYMKEGANRTRPGGEALNQTADVQFILVDRGKIYSAGKAIARRIMISTFKSSHGPSKNIRSAHFAIKQDGFRDTPEFLDPCIRWDYTTVEWFVEHGYLGARMTGGTLADYRYHIDSLGIRGASLEDAALQLFLPENAHHFERLGHELGIPGYFSTQAKEEETEATA
jgi:hypothetical protein